MNSMFPVRISLSPGKFFNFFLFLTLHIFPQSRIETEYRGNYYFDDSELSAQIMLIDLRNNKDSALSVLNKMYYDNGFLDCQTKLDSAVQVDSALFYVFNIEEGEQYRIGNVNFSGGDSIVQNQMDAFTKNLAGIYFSSRAIAENISQLLRWLENNGNPFAKLVIESIVKDTSYRIANLFLVLDQGQKVIIDEIIIKGNTNTNRNVILREIDVKAGEHFSEDKITRIPSQLNRLKFFDPVQLPDFYIDSKGKGTLEITVAEKKVNNFDGIVGYIPPAGDEKRGYFTGLATISLKNLFGTGRASMLRWQKIDRLSSELEFSYYEPRVMDYRINLGGSFFQKKQDSTYVQQRIEALVEFPLTSEIFLSVYYTRETVIPTILEVPVFTVYNSLLNTFSAGIRIDTRDDPYSPTQGIYFNNTFGNTEKKLRGPAEYFSPELPTVFSIKKITLNLSFVYSPFIRQVMYLGLNGKNISGDMLEYSDLFKFGGTRSLRGYRENQFFGSTIGWLNAEYRALLTRRSFVFLFFDTGYYKREHDEKLKISGAEEVKTGYGLGMNIETGVGVLNVSYALAKGDNFSQGKIHFGIINDF